LVTLEHVRLAITCMYTYSLVTRHYGKLAVLTLRVSEQINSFTTNSTIETASALEQKLGAVVSTDSHNNIPQPVNKLKDALILIIHAHSVH